MNYEMSIKPICEQIIESTY